MGDGISVSGGADGVAARYDDMISQAAILEQVGTDFGSVASALAAINMSPDIAEAAVLCPVEVAQAEGALVAANIGPDGAAVAWARAEATAEFLRFSVTAYRDVDALMGELGKDLQFAGGFVAGVVGLPLILGAAVSSPLLDLLLYENRDALLSGAQDTLYDNPWLEEIVTRGAPGFVQGAAFDVAGGNPVLLALLSGGQWPTMDFQGALRGLVATGGLFGVLQDSGNFAVAPVGPPSDPLDFRGGGFLDQVMTQQQNLSQNDGRVQIVTVAGPDGPSYIVQIPGTQDWSPTRGGNPVDLTTNINLEAGYRTKMEQAVVDAMKDARIPPDAPVMLTGHSQGGITAADIAADPQYRSEFNIKSVVTAGSPIGHVKMPGDISVMSLEEKQDIVPKLDGASNPSSPNWVTVTRDLTQGGPIDSGHNLGDAHSLRNYEQTGTYVDASTDPAVARWRAENSQFFGSGSAQQYQISHTGGR